jgi:hypothetical protein
LKITIKSWCAWIAQPDGSFRNIACLAGEMHESVAERPVVENVPPMQKRRLGKLARLVFAAVDEARQGCAQGPVIFSSMMGEIHRTQGILESIATDQPVSPAAFSLSVHNAIAGLWSMLRGNTAPMVALSPPVGSPVPALIEACGMLLEDQPDGVTVVFFEEDFPAFYQPFEAGPSDAFALALHLQNPSDEQSEQDGPTLNLDLLPQGRDAQCPAWLSALDLLPLLRGEQREVRLREPSSSWKLERCA